MKTVNVLIAVRNYSIETSSTGNKYYKIEVQQYATKEVGSEVWTNGVLSTLTGDTKKELSLIKISETMYKLWFKDKLVNGNMLIVTLEEHISQVTQYMDKVQEVHYHGTPETAGNISFDCIEVRQAIALDIVQINGKNHLDGELSDMLPYMIQGIQYANQMAMQQVKPITVKSIYESTQL